MSTLLKTTKFREQSIFWSPRKSEFSEVGFYGLIYADVLVKNHAYGIYP